MYKKQKPLEKPRRIKMKELEHLTNITHSTDSNKEPHSDAKIGLRMSVKKNIYTYI